jgi:hypothetical protein
MFLGVPLWISAVIVILVALLMTDLGIFKKGDKSLPSNYRPISLISCVGKIMERVINKHVFNHLQRNKLIYEYQSAFLPKYSTVHQLLEMYI